MIGDHKVYMVSSCSKCPLLDRIGVQMDEGYMCTHPKTCDKVIPEPTAIPEWCQLYEIHDDCLIVPSEPEETK